MESDSEESLLISFDYQILFDILQLIDFYDFNPTVLALYKTVIDGYKVDTMKQHLDIFEVAEKIRAKNSFQSYQDLDRLTAKICDSIEQKLCYTDYARQSFKMVAEMMAENEDRLQLFSTLFQKINF